jgi:glycine/D-amino acid oxidase-like deaminating enzyme
MAENLVIGGGVFGTGIALEIAKSGRGVRLLEKQNIASGASGGPGRRGVRANGRDVREAIFCFSNKRTPRPLLAISKAMPVPKTPPPITRFSAISNHTIVD